MKILIALCLVALVRSDPASDRLRECSEKGPDYWCTNEETANQCSALHYCKTFKWKNGAIGASEGIKATKAENFDSCTTCQQIIGTAHMMLSNNATQGEVIHLIEGMCKVLPDMVKLMCDEMISMESEKIIKFLKDHTKDPRPLCIALHMCSAPSHNAIAGAEYGLIEEEVSRNKKNQPSNDAKDYIKFIPDSAPQNDAAVPAPSNDMCTTCQQVIGTVRLILSRNESQAAVLEELTAVCQYLPTAEQVYCVAAVKMYGPTLIKMLLDHTQDPRPICRFLGLCAQGCPLVQIKPPSANGICETCKDSISTLYKALAEYNTTIIGFIETACLDLPSEIRPICKSYVPELYKEVLDYLSHPEQLCTEFHLCSGKKILKKRISSEKSISKSNGITCEVCELLMQKLDDKLKGNKTEEAVRKALEELCDEIPFSKQCRSLVDTFDKQILKIVVEELADTDKVCRSLGLCLSAFIYRGKVNSIESIVASQKSLSKSNGITCEVCEFMMKELDDKLKGNKTEEAVKKALDEVCNELPFSKECRSLVDTYSEQILRLVVEELADTHQVCKTLGLCLSAFIPKTPTKKNGFIACEMCVVGVELIISSSKGRVKSFLNAICDLTNNKTEAAQCKEMVQNLTAKITTGVHGETVCKFVGYCDASARIHALQPKELEEPKEPKEELPTCNLCSFMSGKLDASLKPSYSNKMIKAQMRSACSRTKFTEAEMENCQRMINENKKMIVKLTKSTKLPTLCKSIGHCVAGSRGSMFLQSAGLRNYKQTGRCTVCQYVMGILDDALGGHGTKVKIFKKVHNLCNMLPRDIFKTECNALIKEYGGELIDLLIENLLKPKDVCQHFGLC